MIQNYGCHCFPAYTKSVQGIGQHMDIMDLTCKSLGRCHKCVTLEFNEECDTVVGKYKYSVNSTDKTIDCTANTVPCKLAQCECDRQFAINLAKVWKDDEYNYFYWLNKRNIDREGGVFDVDSSCVPRNRRRAPDACCGHDYPFKVPYNSFEQQCCESAGVPFGIGKECCDDGRIVYIGSC